MIIAMMKASKSRLAAMDIEKTAKAYGQKRETVEFWRDHFGRV